MKAILFLGLVISTTFPAAAQVTSPTPILYSTKTVSDMRAISRAALASDYAYRQTGYLSNNIGPRLSGSPQAERAVEYVAAEMRKLGLEVRLQKLSVPHWVRGEEKGDLVEFPGMAPATTQKIVLTALGGSVATPQQGMTAEIVVVRNFEELQALGRSKIEGKIVLFNNKFDAEMASSGYGIDAYRLAGPYRGQGAIAAGRLGAAAVLVRSIGGSQNRLAHTGAMRYDPNVKSIPAAAVANEDAEMIAYLASSGRVRMRLLLTPRTLPNATTYNVIADMKGSEKPDEIVIVSGHLDSWDLGTGALDDACGVAVSMQVPFLLKQLKLRPKRTIRVIAYMNEENGLVGGTTYAREEAANIGRHFAAIESDLGASHPVGFLFTGKPELGNMFAPVSDVLNGHGAGLSRLQPGGVGADIGPLTQAGVPSFAPYFDTRTYFNYHHTEADTFDKIDPRHLAETGSVMAVLAYGLANLERDLPR
ncbi:MAG TPA: M28 family peptidase [Pyrinomonadaceae bacterium]|nr:M28 family peptidase [Pyrinomonadaceae bacterium]